MTYPLAGLRLVIDVQHAWRPAPHARDRGGVFTTDTNLKITEVDLALAYAGALERRALQLGAEVLTNHPVQQTLIGNYWHRALEASAWGAHVYLACHVNAGGGSYASCSYPVPEAARGQAVAAISPAHQLASDLALHLGAENPHELEAARIPAITRGGRGWICIGQVRPPAIAVLVEPFFGDNPAHLRNLGSPAGLEFIGQVLAEGLVAWRSRALSRVPFAV